MSSTTKSSGTRRGLASCSALLAIALTAVQSLTVANAQDIQCSVGLYTDANCSGQPAITGIAVDFTNAPNEIECGSSASLQLAWQQIGKPAAVWAKWDGSRAGMKQNTISFYRGTCPAAPVAAKVRNNSNCVQLSDFNADYTWGCSPGNVERVADNSTFGKREEPESETLRRLRRRDITCDRFDHGDPTQGTTVPARVTATQDCRGQTAPCGFSESQTYAVAQGYTTTIEAGVTVKAEFLGSGVDTSFSTSLANQYTQTETSATTLTQTIPVGQQGYVQAYRPADIYQGTYHCSDGSSYPGSFIGPTGPIEYSVVIIG